MNNSPQTVPVGTLPAEWQELVRAAQEARERAYAPYSHFAVGAAVRGTATGRVYAGANIENASYGLTVCAERVAIWHAVLHGEVAVGALALVTEDGSMPCGACRQVLLEFADPAIPVLAAGVDGQVTVTSLGILLPHAFSPADLV